MTQTQMFNESEQTWADVVRYSISTSSIEQDTDNYTDDYVYDSDIEDKPEEPNDWDPGYLLPLDEEW